MKFEIDQEILAETGQCTKGHRCLSGRPEDLCEAELKLIGRQHFICHNPDPCVYKEPFGSSFFCTCAVRRAIHRKYGK